MAVARQPGLQAHREGILRRQAETGDQAVAEGEDAGRRGHRLRHQRERGKDGNTAGCGEVARFARVEKPSRMVICTESLPAGG
jgi:hypothetical protein